MELDLERFKSVWEQIMSWFTRVFDIIFSIFPKADDSEDATGDEA